MVAGSTLASGLSPIRSGRQRYRHGGLVLPARTSWDSPPGSLSRRPRPAGCTLPLTAAGQPPQSRFPAGPEPVPAPRSASNQLLSAQSKDTFTIVVGATVTGSLAAAATVCNAAGSGTRLLQLCRPDFRLRPVQRSGVRSHHPFAGPDFLTTPSEPFRAASHYRPGAEPRAPLRGRSVRHGCCSRPRFKAQADTAWTPRGSTPKEREPGPACRPSPLSTQASSHR